MSLFPLPHKWCKEWCLAATPSLPPYGCWKPSVTHRLQHPWRYIAAASICPLSSPENNEANNFFNYLSRAASSVNKFVLLSPGGLAFYFIRFFFHKHLKQVLLFILISTARFFSFSTFVFIINFMQFFYFILQAFCHFFSVLDVLWDATWPLINLLTTLFVCFLPPSLNWKKTLHMYYFNWPLSHLIPFLLSGFDLGENWSILLCETPPNKHICSFVMNYFNQQLWNGQ